MAKLLIVEDDLDTQMLLKKILGSAHELHFTSDLASARQLLETKLHNWEIVLLDRTLPDGDGVELCSTLNERRQDSKFSVLMLTAHGSPDDRIHGLSLGADDYVVKPFVPGELVARVDALLRRQRAFEFFQPVMELSNLVLDFHAHEAYIQHSADKKEALNLTPIEFKILSTLAKNFGKEMNREKLANAVWENTNLSARNIDTHVCHIRKKISMSSLVIKNRRGNGYYITHREVESLSTPAHASLQLPNRESEKAHAAY